MVREYPPRQPTDTKYGFFSPVQAGATPSPCRSKYIYGDGGYGQYRTGRENPKVSVYRTADGRHAVTVTEVSLKKEGNGFFEDCIPVGELGNWVGALPSTDALTWPLAVPVSLEDALITMRLTPAQAETATNLGRELSDTAEEAIRRPAMGMP